MDKLTILIVDDETLNIKLLKQLLEEQYNIRAATNGKEALERIQMEPIPSLVLLDVMMPDMDGYSVCREIKSKKGINTIPVIFVSANNEIFDETKGFEAGGVDYITKPIFAPIVKARVSTHISLANQQLISNRIIKKQTHELRMNQESAIHMLGEAGHYNDTDTGEHIWRMASYAKAISTAVQWPVEDAKLMGLAAPMHDTGKIGISDLILSAPRALTEDEWTIMKTHSEIGYSILSKSDTPLFQMAGEIALHHHEKWNGSGYPRALSGSQIPEAARIVAVADVFDALTMKRPYKDPWPIDKAFCEIESMKGKEFDPVIVDAFLNIEAEIRHIKKEMELSL